MRVEKAHVNFMQYDGEIDEFKKVATVYLVGEELAYEGKAADYVRNFVENNPSAEPYREAGAYTMLAQLPHLFSGSMFYATKVKEAHF